MSESVTSAMMTSMSTDGIGLSRTSMTDRISAHCAPGTAEQDHVVVLVHDEAAGACDVTPVSRVELRPRYVARSGMLRPRLDVARAPLPRDRAAEHQVQGLQTELHGLRIA